MCFGMRWGDEGGGFIYSSSTVRGKSGMLLCSKIQKRLFLFLFSLPPGKYIGSGPREASVVKWYDVPPMYLRI